MNKPLLKVRDRGIITTLGREATIIGKYTVDVDHQVVSLNRPFSLVHFVFPIQIM